MDPYNAVYHSGRKCKGRVDLIFTSQRLLYFRPESSLGFKPRAPGKILGMETQEELSVDGWNAYLTLN